MHRPTHPTSQSTCSAHLPHTYSLPDSTTNSLPSSNPGKLPSDYPLPKLSIYRYSSLLNLLAALDSIAYEDPTMSPPTTNTWMLPDNEYYAKTEDYALVGESAKLIRCEIDEGNKFVAKLLSKNPHFIDVLRLYRHGSCYDFASGGGRVIYADVDDSNPDHETEVKQLRGTEQKLDYSAHDEAEAIGDEAIAAREALVKHLLEICKGCYPPDNAEEAQMDQEAFNEWKMCQVLDVFNHNEKDHHLVAPHLLNFMAGPGHEHRQGIMNNVSDQELSPNKRPVMLLIDMVDDLQCPTRGTKVGWALAYDVIEQQIIVKPFFSDKSHHPLTTSWKAAVVDDGVSFASSPAQFVKEYSALAQSIEEKISNGDIEDSEEDLKLQDKTLAFRMLVHTLVVKWVLRHWSGLIGHWCETPEEAADLLQKTMDDEKTIKGYLSRIPFPVVERVNPAGEVKKPPIIGPFEELEWQMVEMEDYFRGGAVAAKEKGEEKIAENVAMLYERILEMVKQFNEDPRGDL